MIIQSDTPTSTGEVHKRTAKRNELSELMGDVLNIMYINNKQFFEACYRVFNPRNAMMISRNDGKFNSDVNWTKDTLINANGMIYLSRKYYTQEQLDRIERAKQLE